MGCAQSSGKQTDEDRQSQAVDKFLSEESVKALLSFKILLLGTQHSLRHVHFSHIGSGAGESGKSTVVKQVTT